MFQRTLRQRTRKIGRNTLAIRTTTPLQYLIITVKVVPPEKLSFSDTQNPKTVVNTLTVDEKRYLLHRDNLTKPIQMQLSQKKRSLSPFSFFFFAFLKSILNFKHFQKKDDPHI